MTESERALLAGEIAHLTALLTELRNRLQYLPDDHLTKACGLLESSIAELANGLGIRPSKEDFATATETVNLNMRPKTQH